MKKETVMAVVLGVGLGIIVAFVMILKTSQGGGDTKTQQELIAAQNPTTVISQAPLQPLEISEPQDGFITTSSSIDIQGKATADSLIVVQTQLQDFTFQSKEESFSQKISLAKGENIVTVAVYPKDKSIRSQQKTLHVYVFEE